MKILISVVYFLSYFTLAFRTLQPPHNRLTKLLASNDVIRSDLIENLMSRCDKFCEEQKKGWDIPKLSSTNTSSLAGGKITLDKLEQEVIEIVRELAKYNPTPLPMENWKNGPGHECKLDGLWKLRFTTAADATFKPGKRGPVTTTQQVNATIGSITNVLEFKENKGTVRSFNVVVEGVQETDNFMGLIFKKIVVIREPRRWIAKKLFSKLTFLLPDFSLLDRFTGVKGKEGQRNSTRPGFEILYLDDDLRIHNTTQGKIFIQSRLYDVWDPMMEKGWTTVSAI